MNIWKKNLILNNYSHYPIKLIFPFVIHSEYLFIFSFKLSNLYIIRLGVRL